jgi:flagellin|tara:strand:- start:177 stop:1004 length:828 start_codon:yes stop_codon:yes gene_type:complete
MISINTNYGGLFAAKATQQSQNLIDKAMERLSTGKRINYAKDDAAGSAIAVRLTAEIQGLAVASRNAADGQSLLDTAEGALQETQTLLMRLRELAVQSSNGTLTTSDRGALQAEAAALEAEISRISDTTSWGGINLLDGSLSDGITFQAGTKEGETIVASIPDMAATAATIAVSVGFSIGAFTNAQSMITAVDAAISGVGTVRGNLGAASNRLNSTIANLDQVRVNLSASRGRIQDADFATETQNLAKGQILQQAATAMLAQANASKQTVLTLIR